MSEIANASINNLRTSTEADFVSPSEESVFVFTSGQLQDLITAAVEKAIQPLQDEVMQLQAIVDRQDEKIAALEATQEQDVNRICLDIAYDRQRLAKLERPPEPQPTQRDRADVLRALLAANGGKMLAKDARKKMHLSAERFSNLLTVCDFIERKPYHMDRRKDILILKSELVRPNY